MDNDHKQVMRGKEAQMVLDNEAFKSAFALLKAAIDEKRASVSVRDPQGLVIAALWERIHKDFESILTGMVKNGEFSQRRIDMDKLRDEPVSRKFFRSLGVS